jgi:hypothetical protein
LVRQGDTVPPLSKPRAILSGSFNPLHDGHRTLAAVVERRLGAPVHFELSTANVDKPDLAEEEVQRRLAQFEGYAPVWVTRAPTFAAKAELFPGAIFAVGFDTAVRMLDPKYAGSVEGRDAALRKIVECGCRVIVGGRVDAGGVFREWKHWEMEQPPELGGLFEVLSEAEFRVDVSSTELRKRS